MRPRAKIAVLGGALLMFNSSSCGATDRHDVTATSDVTVAVEAAVAPKYSPVALALGLVGDVEVMVTVDPGGVVTKAEASTGHDLLQPRAVAAAKGWRFRHQPATGRVKLLFSFRILPREAAEDAAGVTFFPPNRVEVRSKPAPPPIVQDRP